VAAKDGVDFADLFTDRLMSYSLHEFLQRRKAAPRFLGAHPNLEVTFSVSRAIERQASDAGSR